MEDKYNELDNSNLNLKKEEQNDDYDYLLIKLKNIKDSISSLESNF